MSPADRRRPAEDAWTQESRSSGRLYSGALAMAAAIVGFAIATSVTRKADSSRDGIDHAHHHSLRKARNDMAAFTAMEIVEGHHTSSATAGHVFAMTKTRDYTGPRLDIGALGSSEFPSPPSDSLCEQWAVLTSIFAPTDTVIRLGKLPGWCVVVVGDKNGPEEYDAEGVTYLSPSQQEALPYRIASQLPWNHFGRKNVGYLYAIHHGAKVVYDVDDDNDLIASATDIPHASTNVIPESISTFAVGDSATVHNPYACLGGPGNVWPRGYPLNAVNDPDSTGCEEVKGINLITANGEDQLLGVVQALANHDPDVDAIFRMTHPPGALPFDFSSEYSTDSNSPLKLVPPSAFTPYNAQATLHFEPAFWGMLLPVTVHGRVSDIWRSYFTQALLPAAGAVTAFAYPWVEQVRNPHDYLADFQAELQLYERSGALVAFLAEYRAKVSAQGDTPAPLPQLFESLAVEMYEHDIIEEADVLLAQAWLQDLADVGYISTAPGDLAEEPEALQQLPQEAEQELPQVEDDTKFHRMLIIAVVSVRPDRRQAIRESWLAWGDDRVVLRFFTDLVEDEAEGSEEANAALLQEADDHGDLVFTDLERGMNFASKMLWAMRWMSERWSYDYFLRLDDDYFLCLGRLLDELEANRDRLMIEAPMLYGGYRYCSRGRTRVDEANLLVSTGLVHRLLANEELMCAGHAGVSAGWWFKEGGQANVDGDVRWFNDERLDHYGEFWNAKGRTAYPTVCQTHMGVHHTYVEGMGTLWAAAKDNPGTGPGKATGEGSFDYRQDDCHHVREGVEDKAFNSDNAQLCRTFKPVKGGELHCGAEGC